MEKLTRTINDVLSDLQFNFKELDIHLKQLKHADRNELLNSPEFLKELSKNIINCLIIPRLKELTSIMEDF